MCANQTSCLSNKFSSDSQNFLTVLHQNIHSIVNKVDVFVEALTTFDETNKFKTNIICLSEHYLKSAQLTQITIPGYKLISKYCRNKFTGGGVCIFVQDSLTAVPVNLDKFCAEKDIECTATLLKLHTKSVQIISTYRSPSGNFAVFLKQLELLLLKNIKPQIETIICGDFNVNYLEDSHYKNCLNSLLRSFNLFPTVQFPTRIKLNSATAIDNIFVESHNLGKYKIKPLINALSDHDAQVIQLHNIQLTMKQETKYPKFKRIRTINNTSIAHFRADLKNENWVEVFTHNDTNSQFNSFHSNFLRIFEANFPNKSVTVKDNKQKQWLTKGIKVSCKKKRELYLLCRTTSDNILKSYYNNYCKLLNKVITKAKQLHFQDLISVSNNKVKTTWDIIKSLSGKCVKSNPPISVKVNDKQTDVPVEVANAFNSYFLEIVDALLKNKSTKENPLILMEQSMPKTNCSFTFIPTTPKEICEIVYSLASKTSTGYDQISSKLLKDCIHLISAPLSYIFNTSFATGVFPDRLKFTIIKPLHKKNDETSMTNYRPISLIPTFAKILEKLVHKRLSHYLDSNNLLTKSQYGFRNGKSVDEATFELTSSILKSLDKRENVIGLFCDLTKAFDCVDHTILLNKLYYYGIQGTEQQWLTSYLYQRYQQVTITDSNYNEIRSVMGINRYGVPQGSILGPLLFNLYVNDLPYFIRDKANPVLFADDTSILFTQSNIQALANNINETVLKLKDWFDANKMTLNLEKTAFLKFHTQNTKDCDLQIFYGDTAINECSSTKFLGLQLDSCLNGNKHIDSIVPKLNAACFSLRTLGQVMNTVSLKQVYDAYFHSVMAFGIIFWAPSSHNKHIFRIQKRAIRILAGARKLDSCRPLFKKLNILTFSSQYIYSTIKFVVKNLNKFVKTSDVHMYNTRNRSDLHLPLNRLKLSQKGAYFSGIKLFNKLPNDLKELSQKNAKKFKIILKSLLLSHTFYTVDEFLDM